MRQQPIPSQSWSEADALRLMRGLRSTQRNPQPADAPPEAALRAVLTRAVEHQVIPRLLRTKRPEPATRPAARTSGPTTAQQDAFIQLVLHGTPSDTTAYAEGLRDSGMPIEQLYLGLLTPAARRLGVMWEEDTCSFSEVTLGALRLDRVLRLLGRAFCGEFVPNATSPAALLAQVPGEQHGLGLAMVVQFFRRAGWNVRDEPAPTREDLVGIVGQHWFGVVGLSVSCNDRLDSLSADIAAIRRHSRNPAIGVLVGGPPFLAHPQLAAMVGADATAPDGRQAVQTAQSLVARQAGAR